MPFAYFISKLVTLILISSPALAKNTLDLPAIVGRDIYSEKEASFEVDKSKDALVLAFISARCPCSASHDEILRGLSKKFSNIQFLALNSNVDEPFKEVAPHFRHLKIPFVVLKDENAKLADHFGALKTPHVFVFSPQGKLLYDGGITNSHVGPSATKNYLQEVLEDITNKKEPRYSKQRALGCYIQRQET